MITLCSTTGMDKTCSLPYGLLLNETFSVSVFVMLGLHQGPALLRGAGWGAKTA